MIKFWQVAAAILVLQLLDLFWTYAFTQMTDGFDVRLFVVFTLCWLFVAGGIWFTFEWVSKLLADNREFRDRRVD